MHGNDAGEQRHGARGGAGRGRLEVLLDHHRDQLIVGVAVFRTVAALVPLTDPTNIENRGVMLGLVPLSAFIVAVNVTVAVVTPRVRVSASRWVTSLLAVDLGLAVMLNLAGAVVVTLGPSDPIDDTFWYMLQGSVALLTAFGRLRAVLLVVVGGIPLQVLMALLGGSDLDGAVAAKATMATLWLVLAMACSVMVHKVARLHAEAALGHGLDAGAGAEQARLSRQLHDTVLQTLEAIALHSAPDAPDPAARLAVVRRAARRQASELRAVIDAEWPSALGSRSGHLVEGLRIVAEHARADGMDVDLHCTDEVLLDGEVCAAVCDATREALTNVAKHAGTERAWVHVGARGAGIVVEVTDRGRGFDPELAGPGFGVRESIIGRIVDVGGRAEVDGRPGVGTCVRMWLPAVPPSDPSRADRSRLGGAFLPTPARGISRS